MHGEANLVHIMRNEKIVTNAQNKKYRIRPNYRTVRLGFQTYLKNL